MVKVQCKVCKKVWYTACPKRQACICGGKLKKIDTRESQERFLHQESGDSFDSVKVSFHDH